MHKIAEWLLLQKEKNPNFSMMAEERVPVARDLSHFANFVAHFTGDMEVRFLLACPRYLTREKHEYGVKTLHAELLKIFVGVHGAYETCYDMKARAFLSLEKSTNDAPPVQHHSQRCRRDRFVLTVREPNTDVPFTGKSFMMNIVRKNLMVPGVVEATSRATKRAYETTTDKTNSIHMFDEIPLEILGIDEHGLQKGTGDEMIKTAITEQKLKTQVRSSLTLRKH